MKATMRRFSLFVRYAYVPCYIYGIRRKEKSVTHHSTEGQFGQQQIGRLLVFSDLSQCDCSWLESVGFTYVMKERS